MGNTALMGISTIATAGLLWIVVVCDTLVQINIATTALGALPARSQNPTATLGNEERMPFIRNRNRHHEDDNAVAHVDDGESCKTVWCRSGKTVNSLRANACEQFRDSAKGDNGCVLVGVSQAVKRKGQHRHS
jgi:hypothetical protein